MTTDDSPDMAAGNPAGEDLDSDLAAEYALGTLDPQERDAAQALIESAPAFAAQVRRWEARLGELNALAGEVDPPPAVWEGILNKLGGTAPSEAMRLPELSRPAATVAPAASAGPNRNVVDLTARLRRWRSVAAATSAMAAVFALFIVTSAIAPRLLPDAVRLHVVGQMTDSTAPTPARFVAVLQRDAAAPAFILTVDVMSRTLTVRRVAAEREPGKSYELWLVSNKFPAPRSLGLVDNAEFTQPDTLAPYDPSTITDASFAVSLEPEGGSPTGAPSNVMFLGKLVESLPPSPAAPPPGN
jgi:anti-sigma-K factor RskA